MSKKLVGKSEIKTDEKLLLIKAFRVLNKRVGECKNEINENSDNNDLNAELVAKANEAISKMRILAKKAEIFGFHIWVNDDGQTGHTYEKDYKVTSDEINNWEEYKASCDERNNAVEALINGIERPLLESGDDSMN